MKNGKKDEAIAKLTGFYKRLKLHEKIFPIILV